MPLFDHFRKPLLHSHQWMSFHSRWATSIADDLNLRLPKRFLAEGPFGLGRYASADVAEVDQSPDFDRGPSNGVPLLGNGTGGLAVAIEPVLYAPPVPELSMSAEFPEEVLVEIRDLQRGRQVLAVVEIVSPGNKDDEEAKLSFAGKCLSYLSKGIGLVVLDIVTEGAENLHNVMIHLAKQDVQFEMAGDPQTYAASYRPVRRKRQDFIDLWHWPLVVGEALPTIPLALKGYGCIALNLEATYSEACVRARIPS